MRDFRLKALEVFGSKPTPHLGRRPAGIDFDDIHYYMKPPTARARPGTTCRPTSRTRSTSSASPRPSGSSWPASAQYESEVVYGSREDLAKKGVIFIDTDTALREYPDLVREYFGTIIPIHDNKFAALNSAVWSGGSFVYIPAGREGRLPAPGLLPHQRREHGPVRADADHRRGRGPGPLRRGLHGPDVHDREPALGGRRDRRQEGRPLPLHDDPELGEQHLQPRHQAGRGPRGRADGVGRRQPRQPR